MSPAGPSAHAPAEGAIVGASIRTLDAARPAASALAWRDGVLIAVGQDDEIRPHIGSRTRVSTLGEVRARLAEERRRCGPDAWVLGHSVRYEPFHESGIRADAVADVLGEGPALIGFFDAHTALATQPALALAGVTGPREFGEWSEVVCDPDGRPTGALLEFGAMDLVREVVPSLSEAERLDAFAETFRALNRVGLTGAHVMLGDPELLDVCRALEQRGLLTARCLMPMHQSPTIGDEEVEARLGLAGAHGVRWRAGTAKFFLDGVIDSGTAWLVDPGAGRRERHSVLAERRALRRAGRPLHAGGLQHDHPRGGRRRGARSARRLRGRGSPGPRDAPRRAHRDADRRRPPALPRFRALDVAASMQPLHMEGLDDPSTPSAWVEGLSEGRFERGFRTADLAAGGALLPLGSDWMVADCDPRVGMAWARLRRRPGSPDRVPYGPEQALSAQQALLGYTVWPAVVAGDEQVYGRLRPGMRADITVLGADPVRVLPDELPDVPVAATVVDGELVHQAEE